MRVLMSHVYIGALTNVLISHVYIRTITNECVNFTCLRVMCSGGGQGQLEQGPDVRQGRAPARHHYSQGHSLGDLLHEGRGGRTCCLQTR